MTEQEFSLEYDRAKQVHPFAYGSQEKMTTVWRFVQAMELNWFRALVDRIVMSPRGDLDIGEAVAGERRHRRSKEFADDVIRASNAMAGRMSDEGLSNVLNVYGAKSLFDAVQKSRRGDL